MSVMRFAKLHGLGNDFVLLDLRGGGEPLPAERALQLCDRHLGVGADGILTLLPGERMLLQNADGSVPEMCGNGARSGALSVASAGGTQTAQAHVMLLTDAGSRPCVVETSDPRSGLVEVDMGFGQIEAARPLPLGDRSVDAWPVSMGNPHRVMFVDGNPLSLAKEFGPALSRAEDANIEFVTRNGVQAWRGAG